MRRSNLIGGIIIFAVIVIISASLWLAPQAKIPSIQTMKVEVRNSSIPIVSGIVERTATEVIEPDISRGTLEKVYVQIGDKVEKGTPLFQFESDDSEFRLAEFDVNRLKKEVQQLRTISQSSSPTPSQSVKFSEQNSVSNPNMVSLQNTEQELKRAELQLEVLKNKRSQLTQVSTKAGIVSQIDHKTHTINIQYDVVPVVRARIPESLRTNLTNGTSVTATFSSEPNRSWKGTLISLGTVPLISETASDISYYEGVIQLDNADNLLHGYHVDLAMGKIEETLWVPKSAVQDNCVWVKKGKYAILKNIETGKTEKSSILVQKGLNVNDVVVKSPDPSWRGKKEVALP